MNLSTHQIKSTILISFLTLMLTSCASAAQMEAIPLTPTPQSSGTATETPIPTATQTTTTEPTYTQTPTVTPAQALSMQYLSQQTYAAELIIEEELSQEETYNRFIVSYVSEGNKNYAYFTVPSGDIPESGWPVIVFNHGYIQPDLYRSTQGYEKYMHAFASHGYIVLRPDYRGHGYSEGKPVNTYFHQGNTIDVLNAVAAVKQWETADPKRIGMWGHSTGGWITIRAMSTDADIRVGVVWSGVLGSYEDLCLHWFNCDNWDEETWSYWSETPFAEFGLPSENETFWDVASMDLYLSDFQGVVQLHHAVTDTSVPVALSRVMAEKMEVVGIQVEYYEYPNDDHNLSYNFALAMQRSLDFFDINL